MDPELGPDFDLEPEDRPRRPNWFLRAVAVLLVIALLYLALAFLFPARPAPVHITDGM